MTCIVIIIAMLYSYSGAASHSQQGAWKEKSKVFKNKTSNTCVVEKSNYSENGTEKN